MNHNNTVTDISFLPANQTKALNALLRTTTISEAATECGLSLATVKRYLRDERFAKVYREQRKLILQETVAALTGLGSQAVQKLEAAMHAEDENTSLRAACRVLDYITKLVELERKIRDQDELEARLSELEDALSHQNGHRWG
jgi:AcrR family transcriptional regulator